MNSLRKDLIKLAYAQPELRADLLPLLKFSNLKDLPKVYADASAMTDADLDKAMGNRKLMWRSNQWVSLTAWHKAMKGAVPFGYNDFDADKVFRWLKKYAGKGNLELQAAREYSPALYIKSDDPDLLAQIEKSGRRGGGGADESDIRKDGTLRLWWD